MAQHFLLSAAARTLSLKAIYQDGEDKAYETFKAIRWNETDGAPVCPRSAVLPTIMPSRPVASSSARPRVAGTSSAVTSGTIFASRKMAFVDMLGAICIFVNGVKGISARR